MGVETSWAERNDNQGPSEKKTTGCQQPPSPSVQHTAGSDKHLSQREETEKLNDPLKIVYLNARSIASKTNELAVLTNEQYPDLLLITESWCNGSITDAFLQLDNYNLEIREDRTDTANGIGGGLLVYAKKGITISRRDKSSSFNQYCCFSVSCEGKQDLNVTLVYRSPNSSAANNSELLEMMASHPKNMLIVGDFNFPGINWKNKTANGKGHPLLEMSEDLFLTQSVEFPTHYRGNVLDLAFVDKPENIYNIEDLGYLGNSDHKSILIEIDVSHSFCSSTEYVRDWSNGDSVGLRKFFSSQKWTENMSDMDTETAWQLMKDTIDHGVSRYVPLKLRRQINTPPWLNQNVKRLSRKKRKLWNTYKSTNSPNDYDNFKRAEKECRRAVRASKRKFEKKLSNTEHKRNFNSYVKRRLKTRSGIGPLKVSGTTLSSNIDMAKELNRYFVSVFTSGDLRGGDIDKDGDIPDLLDVDFTTQDIIKKIDKLKTSSAPGPDGITTSLLKEYKNELAPALFTIFRKSLDEGITPADWRTANVTPIFKKGKKSEPSNYRPVSLTSVVCKLLESLLRDKMMDHLLTHNLLNHSQHGFMSHKSCTTNLLEFLEEVLREVDEGIPVDVAYLDFSKAFDKVHWGQLLRKVEGHNINGKVVQWISSWLSDRHQRVVVNGATSNWEPVTSGVPQGSVLGPILFLLYINDIDKSAGTLTTLKKFADDTKLGQVVNDTIGVQRLQNCLDDLEDWASCWGMAFNVSKCKILHMGKNNMSHKYRIGGVEVPNHQEERDIGVIIHDSLKPSMQCAESARKANAVLGQLTRSFHYRDRHIFKRLYVQQVRPLLEFCTPAWSPWTAGDKEVIEKVQKRFTNMVSGLNGRTYRDKLDELGLLTLENRRLQLDLVQVYKIIHNLDNVQCDTWFNLVGDNPVTNTRQNSNPVNIKMRRVKLDVFRHFFSNRVVEHWNALPDEMKNKKKIQTFKRDLKKLLSQKQSEGL